MTDSAPRVTVVIPSWNGRALLADALPSVVALAYPRERLEVLVVDDGSDDDSVAWLRDAWPAVRVVANATNAGFAAACNAGAEAATGDLVAFLNNDLRVDPTWLERMTSALAGAGAAAAGSRILDWEGTRLDFDGAAMNFYGHGTSRRHGRSIAKACADAVVPALFACGAAMLVDRARFLASGGFDADYYAYFEDVDLGWRLWVRGERVVYVPAAVAWHRHHGSAMNADRRTALLERNALASVVKNYDDANLARVLPAALLLVEARARFSVGARAALYRDTLARFLDELPALRRKRDAVQAARGRSDREIVPLFAEPLRPSFFGREYWREQVRVVRAFEIDAMVGSTDMSDFIEDLEGRIEELERELAAARRTADERSAECARLAAELARVRDEIARGTPAPRPRVLGGREGA